MAISPTNAPTLVGQSIFGVYGFDMDALLAKVGFWFERGYGVSADANGVVTSWTSRYGSVVATPYTSGPTVAPDGSLRGNGTQDLQIPNQLAFQAPGNGGAGINVFARLKSTQTGTLKGIAGHWDGGAPTAGVDDWIMLANSVSNANLGSFGVNENTLTLREATGAYKVSTGRYATLYGQWSGSGSAVVCRTDGTASSQPTVTTANATALAANPILLFRYGPTGAAVTGWMSADLAAFVLFTSQLTNNERYYMQAYLAGMV